MPDPLDELLAKPPAKRDALDDLMATKPKTDVLRSGPGFGMNDDQILRYAGYTADQIRTIKTASSYKPGAFAQLMTNPDSTATKLRNADLPQDAVLRAMGQPNSVQLAQVGLHGLAQPLRAIGQMSNHLSGSLGIKKPEDVLFDDALDHIEDLNFKQNAIPGAYRNGRGGTPIITRAADFVGENVPLLLLPEEKGAEGAGLLAKMAKGAKTGAKIGALGAALTPQDMPSENYWSDTFKRVGAGGLGGAFVGGGLPVAGAVVSPLADRVAPRFQAMLGKSVPLTPEAAKIIAETEAYGIKLKPSQIQDLVKKNTLPDELIQARAAADAFGSELRQRVTDTPFAGIDEVKAAANGVGKRSDAAKALLDQIDNAGVEAHDLVQTSAGLQAFRAKLKADALYAYRDKLGASLTDIETPHALAAIDDSIAQLKLSNVPGNQSKIDALEAFKAKMQGPSAAPDHLGRVGSGGRPVVIRNGEPLAAPAIDPLAHGGGPPVIIRNGVPIPPTEDIYGTVTSPGSNAAPVFQRGPVGPADIQPPKPSFSQGPAPAAETGGNRSFQALSATRSDLTKQIAKAYKGDSAVVGSLDAETLQPIKKGLEADLQAAAEKSGNPELIQADRAARKFYSEYSGTFKDPSIVAAVKSADPDKVFDAFAKAGVKKAQRIYDALDPKGQAAAASGFFNQALDSGLNKRTGTWIPGNVSAKLFDLRKSMGVAFNATDAARLDGIQNLMQTLAKMEPEQASALGERFAGIAEQAGGKTGSLMKAYTSLKNGGTDLLFNSPKGKQILFAAKSVKPGSPAAVDLTNRMVTLLSTNKTAPPLTPLPLAADAGSQSTTQEAQVNP